MVKEIPRPSKYQCEGCGEIYSSEKNAVKCEDIGLPEFKYKVGDEVETIIQLTKVSETLVNGNIPNRIFDIGGEFAKIGITDRYYWDHKPFYVFEHPQIQGQYWRYPELAFELPDELNENREVVPNKVFEIKVPYFNIQFNEKAIWFKSIWSEFDNFLYNRIADKYRPAIVAEPINPK